jgi:hypothetical protein
VTQRVGAKYLLVALASFGDFDNALGQHLPYRFSVAIKLDPAGQDGLLCFVERAHQDKNFVGVEGPCISIDVSKHVKLPLRRERGSVSQPPMPGARPLSR